VLVNGQHLALTDAVAPALAAGGLQVSEILATSA
jgi:hypothetical protein